MSKNIERRGNTWYATLHVPPDVRHIIGKSKFFESLKTTDKRIAETRAAPIVANWKAKIAAARGTSDPFLEEALRLRTILEKAPTDAEPGEYSQRDIELEAVGEIAAQVAKDNDELNLFRAIATGKETLLSSYYDEWAGHLTQAPKTIDQMKKDVTLLVEHFRTIERINKASVIEWIRELMAGTPERKPYTTSSLERIFKFSRSFWGYLQEIGKADPERQPLALPSFAKRSNGKTKGGSDGWIPFDPLEVVTLLDAAVEKEDHQLADLIRLGMYSGARIEELCALRLNDCTTEVLKITDSKTEAGIREVPVHSLLVPVIERLKENSADDYLLSGLTFNKYNDRSNAVGKRFGRLKKSLGFPSKKVFHSIRKTVVTLLENAGISENLAADIVGHEKPRITYGLYSGGATLPVKKGALELVRYPFPKQTQPEVTGPVAA